MHTLSWARSESREASGCRLLRSQSFMPPVLEDACKPLPCTPGGIEYFPTPSAVGWLYDSLWPVKSGRSDRASSRPGSCISIILCSMTSWEAFSSCRFSPAWGGGWSWNRHVKPTRTHSSVAWARVCEGGNRLRCKNVRRYQ